MNDLLAAVLAERFPRAQEVEAEKRGTPAAGDPELVKYRRRRDLCKALGGDPQEHQEAA